MGRPATIFYGAGRARRGYRSMKCSSTTLPSFASRGGFLAGVSLLLLFAMVLPLPLAAAKEQATFKAKPVTIDAEAPAKKLVFLDFYNEASDANLQYLSQSIGNAVDTAIKDKYRYSRIPEATWKKYTKDNNWTEKDFYDRKKVREMGKALGADGVIYGKYNSADQQLEIHAVIFSVIDGEVVDEQDAKAPISAEMFETINQVSDNLAKKIKDLFVPSDRGALTRSLLFPGWGHFYKQRTGWGNFWMISGGTALAFAATMTTMFIVVRAQYTAYEPQVYKNSAGGTGHYNQTEAQAEFDRLEAKGNQYGQLALIGGGITAGIWLISMAHAYFIAPDAGNVLRKDNKTAALPLQFHLGADHSQVLGLRASFSYTWGFQ